MVAACRQGEHLLDEPAHLALLGAVERVAEGKLSPASLARYRTNCPPVPFGEQQLWEEDSEELNQSNLIKHAVWFSGGSDLRHLEGCLLEAAQGLYRRPAMHEGLRDQCRLVRDIFGNPFRPVAVNPDWLRWNGGVVEHLARAAYEERTLPGGELDATRLSILADALEDAGCTYGEILNHLRSPGPHVRGCWAVDLLLGKE
jgi:hypothetical protein